jgi:hypothetical protein
MGMMRQLYSRPFFSGKRTHGNRTHLIGVSVGTRAGREVLEERGIFFVLGIEPDFFEDPAHSLVAVPTETARIVENMAAG